MAFLGKVVAITGGASGIGLATVKELWARGASLAICDINKKALENLPSLLPQNKSNGSQKVTTMTVDVTKSADVDSWIASAIKNHGQLDHAANIAGASDGPGFLVDKKDDDFDFCINLCLRGVFNSMRAELRNMTKGASIVNISSEAGLRGMAGLSLYCAAKHGVNGMTKVAAAEYGPMGIRVNAICPGIIKTPALETPAALAHVQPAIDRTPLKRMAESSEIAKAVVYLLSDEASFQNGSIVPVDGGSSNC